MFRWNPVTSVISSRIFYLSRRLAVRYFVSVIASISSRLVAKLSCLPVLSPAIWNFDG
jgi:hypothetical protein